MNEKTKRIDINGKQVICNTMPATAGYSTAMRLAGAYGQELTEQNVKTLRECLYAMLKFCKLVLPDGREVSLDNESFVDQHFETEELMRLQGELINFNFGFLRKGDRSDSSKE